MSEIKKWQKEMMEINLNLGIIINKDGSFQWVDINGGQIISNDLDRTSSGMEFLESHPKGSRKWRKYAAEGKKEF